MIDMKDIGFFEGAEKLLEVWFDGDDETADLRIIPRWELDALLNIINAEIVSFTKNQSIDSYVLSESSMFISRNRFIIKTCGIIKLLYAVEPLIKLATKYASMPQVKNFFYSRRVFLRPEEQRGIHKTFNGEVAYLDKIIQNGSAYVLGRVQSEQWYLYTMDNASPGTSSSDVTLEILMSHLDPTIMAQFSTISYSNCDDLIRNCGISRFIPGSVNDGRLFDPIGFSLNGLFDDSYYTIHVTPQDICSYVSFETNLREQDYTELINRVVSTFKPAKFIITLFSTKGAPCGVASQAMQRVTVEGYNCDDQHYQPLKNYSLGYQHYIRCSAL